MELTKLTSAIYNDLVSGLAGFNANPTISFEQLEDEVIEKRQAVVKEMYLKNLLKKDDLMVAINCIPVDCDDPSKCCEAPSGKVAMHFEIPQLMDDLGDEAIFYIGSTDRKHPYTIYFNPTLVEVHQYKRHGKDKPYVYIEKTPNENDKYDGWIYNAPFAKMITIIGIFKDLRQLAEYNCCNNPEFFEVGSISSEIKARILKEKFSYYRQALAQPQPTNLIHR